MAGGLMQLVAYGSQDVYLTGNPQVTFFKVVYRRHTNFSVEAIEQSFNGTVDYGKKVSCTISRNGDLIYRMYLEITLPSVDISANFTDCSSAHWVNYIGERLINYVEVEIGGQRIDKHYGEWLHIWNQLSLPSGQEYAYQRMVGNVPKLTANYKNPSISSIIGKTIPETKLYIPLQFWFCRNPGLALPLIALQYHEVKINIQFEELRYLFYMTGTDASATLLTPDSSRIDPVVSSSLWVDYIFLDTDERRRFAQLSHEYLIEQLQFTGADTVNAGSSSLKSIRMNFNHPCKELIWVIKPTPDTSSTNFVSTPYWNNFTDRNADNQYVLAKNPVTLAKIQLNGNDRFAERKGSYFSLVQPYQHHENTPDNFNSGINVYSFAIKPEEHQPSGTLNMSRIDTAVLSVASTVAGTIYIYTVNYNVLRILSGMGGLAYSN
jgi:hypothetical protein